MCYDTNCQQPPPECQYSDDELETYEKLELVRGQILHRSFVNSKLGKIRSDECVIFGDGQQSEGCAREEFRTYVSVHCLGMARNGNLVSLGGLICSFKWHRCC